MLESKYNNQYQLSLKSYIRPNKKKSSWFLQKEEDEGFLYFLFKFFPQDGRQAFKFKMATNFSAFYL